MENEESTLDKNLPPHLWRKIIELVPKKYRQNISLVNSVFYEIICIMDERELSITATNVSIQIKT